MSEERWLPVVGWEGLYEVSDHGRVRSLPRVEVNSRGVTRQLRGRMLTLTPSSTGYPQVHLRRATTNGTTVHVHRLVALAFLGLQPAGAAVCHNDGSRTNNTVTNLRWDTPLENARDAVRHGTHRNTRRTHCKNGHLLEGDNLRANKDGKRVCRTCNNAWQRARSARIREQRSAA